VESDEDAGLTLAEVFGRNQVEFGNRLPEQLDDLVAGAPFRTTSLNVDLERRHVHIGRMRGVLRDHDLLGLRDDVLSRGGIDSSRFGAQDFCDRRLQTDLEFVDDVLRHLLRVENDGGVGHVCSPVGNWGWGNYRLKPESQ